MDRLIDEYEVRIIEAGCAPGSGRYGLQIDVQEDISPLFPYLNGILVNVQYDPDNQILIWRDEEQAYALRPHEIRLARLKEPVQARAVASEIVDKLNRIWSDRLNLTPRYIERRPPAVIDVFKLLPKTNCKQCGYPTCLAYAAALRAGEARLEQCPPLSEPGYAENRRKILELLSAQ